MLLSKFSLKMFKLANFQIKNSSFSLLRLFSSNCGNENCLLQLPKVVTVVLRLWFYELSFFTYIFNTKNGSTFICFFAFFTINIKFYVHCSIWKHQIVNMVNYSQRSQMHLKKRANTKLSDLFTVRMNE